MASTKQFELERRITTAASLGDSRAQGCLENKAFEVDSSAIGDDRDAARETYDIPDIRFTDASLTLRVVPTPFAV